MVKAIEARTETKQLVDPFRISTKFDPFHYCALVMGSLNRGNNVVLQARGMAIMTAIDTSQIVRRQMNKDIEVSAVIGTVQVEWRPREERGKPQRKDTRKPAPRL